MTKFRCVMINNENDLASPEKIAGMFRLQDKMITSTKRKVQQHIARISIIWAKIKTPFHTEFQFPQKTKKPLKEILTVTYLADPKITLIVHAKDF